MNIEKVEWEWVEAVKNKKVYRPYEFIRTKTKEEALDAIAFIFGDLDPGTHYTITVLKDGAYLTYKFNNMPCLGGLVKYKDTHGDAYSMNPYFPRDIQLAFPDGELVFIGLYRSKAKAILEHPYHSFVLSPESPWINGFNSADTVLFGDNYMVFTDMSTDPTVWYSLMSLGKLRQSGQYHENHITHPKAMVLYGLRYNADPRRLAGQKPINISGGTWAEGFGYTRPYNGSIFKTKIPVKLSEFHTLSSKMPTSEAEHSIKYFNDTMKKMFKVDVDQVLKDSSVNDACVEAWDYFKEQSKELDCGNA